MEVARVAQRGAVALVAVAGDRSGVVARRRRGPAASGAMTVSAGDKVGAPCPNQFGQRGGEERGAWGSASSRSRSGEGEATRGGRG